MSISAIQGFLTHELHRAPARLSTVRFGTCHHLKLARRVHRLQRRLARVGT